MNHDAPKISLLLHNYNHGEFLSRSLSAIENQTKRPYEVVILDDGSSDNSIEVIKSFVENNVNFKFHKNTSNMGIIYSMNKLLELATGTFVVFTASDDILMLGFIERYIDVLTNNHNVDLIHSCGTVFSNDADIKMISELDSFKLSKLPVNNNLTQYTPKSFVKSCNRTYINICSNTVMCKKQLLVKYGGFDETLKWHTDWFSFYTIALRHDSIKLNEHLTLYYINDDSFHKQGMRDSKKQFLVINSIFNKILQPDNVDLLKTFKQCPNLLTLFKPSLLLKCSLKSKNNLNFLAPTLFYILLKPKAYILSIKYKLYLTLNAHFPAIYAFLKNLKNGTKNAKT